MKRCIICGNVGADDSTTCEVCGNPYLEVEEEGPVLVDGEELSDSGETEEVLEENAPGIVHMQDDFAGTDGGAQERDAAGPERAGVRESAAAGPERAQVRESAATGPERAQVREQDATGPERAGVREGAAAGPERAQVRESAATGPERAGVRESAATGPETKPQPCGKDDQARPGRARSTAARRGMQAGGQRQSGRGIYGQDAPEGDPSGSDAERMAGQGSYRQERKGESQQRQEYVQDGSRPGRQSAGPGGTAGDRQPGRAGGAPEGRRQEVPGSRPGQPQARPAYGPNGQAGNPQGRPGNGQGAPSAGRPSGYGQNGMGRPMAAVMKADRVREASRGALRSPVLLLVALLNTVSLISSIAAIFLKELNYSQIVRLVSGIGIPAQYAGYMDDLMKIMAKLDTGAVALNIVMQIPGFLLCLGLWLILFAGRSRKEEIPSGGFLLVKIYVIIGLVINSVIMLVGLVIAVALTVSAWAAGARNMKIAAVALLVMMIVAAMLVVMYHFCYLGTLKAVRFNASGNENCGKASAYVALVHIVMGLFGIISLLSGIVNSEITGILGGVSRLGWMLLFAVWIFMYRGRLSEAEE